MANVAELFGASSCVSAIVVSDAPIHTTRGWMLGDERISVPHDSQLCEFEWDKALGAYIASFTWGTPSAVSC